MNLIKKTWQDKAFIRSLFTLALPIILQNLISFSVSMTDTVMLGFVGQEQMSAVTLANAAFFVINLMIFGFQSGESVMISQYWGKGDKKSISRILGVAWLCVLTLTMGFAVFAMFNPQAIMRIFSKEQHIIELGAQYIRAVAIAYPLNAFTSIYISAHRSMENTKLGLFVFGTSAVLNTVLNYIFIFGTFGAPEMGVLGAAVGTVGARIVEFIIVMFYIFRNKIFKLDLKAVFRPGAVIVKDFIRYATPVICNETLWGTGFSALSAIYGHMGSEVVASITICRNLESIFNVIAFAVANAAVVIIGKQLGSGNKAEVYETGKKLVLIAGFFSIFTMMALLLFSPAIISVFSFPDATKALAMSAIYVYAARIIPMNVNCAIIVGVLRGGGDTRAAALIDVLPLWCISVPLAAFLGLVLKVPPVFVFMPNLLEDACKMIIGLRRFKSRAWINNITKEV